MKFKKFAPLLIIAAGIILGILFSTSKSNLKSTSNTKSISHTKSEQEADSKSKNLFSDVKLKSSESTIQTTSMDIDFISNSDKVSKTKLVTSYKYNGVSDLKGVQIWFKITPQSQIGSFDTNDTKYNPEDSKTSNMLVYDIPPIKAMTKGENTVMFFGRETKELTIQAELRAPNGKSATSNPITLTIN